MGIFNRVSNLEFQNFISPTDTSNKYYENYAEHQRIMRNIYIVILTVFTFIGVISLITFYLLRNWYIIKQRNFWLTFMNGLFAFISAFVTLLVQVISAPCGVSLYTSNVINPFYNSIFLSRSLRIILLYHFNIFKVTELRKRNKNRMKETYVGEKEPNNYLPKVYKKVNRIIYAVIIIPTLIALISTILLQKVIHRDIQCGFTNIGNATNNLKQNEGNVAPLFIVAQVFGYILAVVMLVILVFLYKVKDSSKYGVKFECISTIILVITITLIMAILNSVINKARSTHIEKNMMLTMQGQEFISDDYPIKLFLIIYDWTKGGRALYCIISMYMIFASIILPCIKCWESKREKNKYFHEPTSSIQYFYKVLNSPPLLEELKSIAIKEFSVENVLFWENYQILQKMVYRYQIEYKKAERIGNPRLVSQYDFEGYYQQQLQNFSVSSMDDYSYDPNLPVPREIMPYYINFYHTFIDTLSSASVNLSGASIKHIYAELSNYPTVGMYDNAKNEIVEMMYSSIFPILLRKNRKHLHSNTVHY